MKKKLIVLSGFVSSFAPAIALAAPVGARDLGCAVGPTTTTLMSILCRVNELFGIVVPILIALGVIYFIWGVVSYVIGTDEETKASARQKIIYGIIGLAVIIGVWGLVGILNRTFGVGPSGVVPPAVPGYDN